MQNTCGVVIAALHSGSGKTLLSCAMMQALKNRGKEVRAFKCGPDYIDPMFHRQVIGVPSQNLDTFFVDDEAVRKIFADCMQDGDIAVIEGVMGLYDGLGGTRKEGSAYHLAQVLDLPIVLVVDAHGMGRTLLPLLAGILSYDVDHRIAGVILNRTSGAFCQRLSPLMEEELGLRCLGYFPKAQGLTLESRHLGLKLPEEVVDLKMRLQKAADLLEASVDVEALTNVAGDYARKTTVPAVPGCREHNCDGNSAESASDDSETVRIAIAQDEVFCFYYEENLRLLREAGATLVPFSPLHDPELPAGMDGLLLGGGYPELRLRELTENISMRESVRQAIAGGMPSVAECGGFLYLHKGIVGADGQIYPMVGAIEAQASNQGRLAGLP